MGAVLSVVIPTFNGRSRGFLDRAIESVLAQSRRPDEILLVDDGGTDGTADWVRPRYPAIRVITKANGGLASARNAGVAAARGDLVAFLDDDDEWAPEKLHVQEEVLARDPGIGLCLCGMDFIGPSNEPLGRAEFKPLGRTWPSILLSNHLPPPSTLLARKAAILAAGGFGEGLSLGEDFDFWIRASRVTRLVVLEEALLRYRRHGAQMTHGHDRLDAVTYEIVSRHGAELAPGVARRVRLYVWLGSLARACLRRDTAAAGRWLSRAEPGFLLELPCALVRVAGLAVASFPGGALPFRRFEYSLFVGSESSRAVPPALPMSSVPARAPLSSSASDDPGIAPRASVSGERGDLGRVGQPREPNDPNDAGRLPR